MEAAVNAAKGQRSGPFPDEWLRRHSQQELEDSAAEAAKWREMTRNAFKHVWSNYHSHAWGADEFNPVNGQPARVWCNCGLQILDAMSTIWLMGLREEFDAAAEWVEKSLNFDDTGLVSFFEITIRALGGLASAHSLSGRDIFLKKALLLAEKMLPAFRDSDGFPAAQVDVRNGVGQNGWYAGTILAEAGTLQLEWRHLSQQTGDPRFAAKADKAMRSVFEAAKNRGLVPYGLSRDGPPHFTNDHITFGAMGDSYYEYLVKVWVQTDKMEPEWKDHWKKAMAETEDKLINRDDAKLTFIAEMKNGQIDNKMDHLACFVGGMLIYGARQLDPSDVDPRWERDAAGITETCYQMYHQQPSHLAAEASAFLSRGGGYDMTVWNNAAHYLLRPETAEAVFYMFYYTGDHKYRAMAGEIITAIEEHTKTQYGYSAVADVRSTDPSSRGEMETFFLAETLKYLYLTFLPNPREVLDLDEFVLTTEAHPIRIFRSESPKNSKNSKFLAPRRPR